MKEKSDNKLTILLCTCDSYEDLWDPFFILFDKFGGKLKEYPIIINTERKKYQYPGLNITCINQKDDEKNMEWGRRLRNVLSNISTEYVMLLLEDFFLVREVTTEDYNRILSCISAMEADPEIGGMNLIPLYGADASKEINGFCLINPGTPYRFNAQACLWRRKVLFDSILDIESPWEWELYGNVRNDYLIKSEIYCLKDGEREPFSYGFYDYGKTEEDGSYMAKFGVMRGKWYLPSVKKLFKDNGIKVDYSLRGIYKESIRHRLRRNGLLRNMVIIPYRKLRFLIKKEKMLKLQEISEKEKEKYMERLVYPYINKN